MRILFNGGKGFVFIGLMMVLMGLMVFLYPRFFAYIFAGVVMLLGILFTGIGLLAKPMVPPQQQGQRPDDGFSSYEEIND